MSAYIIEKHLTNIISGPFQKLISDSTKIASKYQYLKRRETKTRKLHTSKYFKLFFENLWKVLTFSNKFLSDFIFACRKGYKYNSCCDKTYWKLENNAR